MTEQDQWLTLGEAARRLGIHTNTLRRWADEGHIPHNLTLGGHRRFAIDDIDTLLAQHRHQTGEQVLGNTWAETALAQTRAEIVAHGDRPWLVAFEGPERDEKRALGRRLLALMLQHIAQDGQDPGIVSEAQAIGAAYGVNAQAAGMPLTVALSAVLFFRDMMTATALDLPDTYSIRPQEQRRMVGRITGLLNEVEMAIAATYERGS